VKAVFADAFYFVALLNRGDQHHVKVTAAARQLRESLITTEWVPMELADALAESGSRRLVAPFIPLEWNPTIASDADVLGTWVDRTQTITLAANYTFTDRAPSQFTTGTWTRHDWNLYLRGGNYSATMRFVKFRAVYRLITNPPGDPDTWDGDLGLRQVHP
jgi:hypothetical protein